MKKILILALIAMSLLTSCGKMGEYKVDFKKAVSEKSLNEVVEYFKSMNSSVPENIIKEEVNNMANVVKAADKLKLDLDDDYEKALELIGGKETIDNALKSDIPSAYIDFSLAYQTSNSAILEHMGEKNLLEDGKDYFLENYWRSKHVLISTDGKSDAEKADAKKLAEDILKRAESGENFDKLVEEYSEDPGSKTNPDGYVFTTGEMVQEFEDGTKNTEVGKFCMVETSYGYHVIQRLAIDETPELYEKFYTEANIDSLVNGSKVMDFVNQTIK